MLNKMIIILGLIVLLWIPACFHPDGAELPESKSFITVKITRAPSVDTQGNQTDKGAVLSRVLAAVDSVLVKVFHSGSGRDLETYKGVRIPNGSGSTLITLAVSPETGKQVSVELFETRRLIYFGVDEDVDVAWGKETVLTIDAFRFELTGFGTDASYVTNGEDFRLFWRSVLSAEAYYLQESTTPDFTNVVYELALTDTAVTFTRNEGPHYFRVAPFNSYTFGTYCNPRFVYVYGPPTITSITPGAARDEAFTIQGTSLDYQGNEVRIGNLNCVISSASPEEIVAVIPPTAFTDTLVVTGPLGTAKSDGRFMVQLIAFVSGGGLQTAQAYKALIEAPGEHSAYIRASGVKIIPYTELDALDMTGMTVFALIILGADTGDEFSWADGIQARINKVRGSDAQVIGLGLGGHAYFRETQLYIGQQKTMQTMSRTVYVFDPADHFYTNPVPVVIPPNGILEIHKLDIPQLSVELSFGIKPINVDVHARVELGSDFYPLVNENQNGLDPSLTNFLWGFSGSPVTMTMGGQNCFMNIVAILFNASAKIAVPVAN